MTDFTADDFDAELPDNVARPMLNVIIAFAKLDTALSAWLIQAYGMPLDRGALLVENMDLGNKINRLKKFYNHTGNASVVKNLTRLKADFEEHKIVRNTIAHATYAGIAKRERETAIFSPMRAAVGKLDNLEIVQITAAQMTATAAWAEKAAEVVMRTYEKIEGQLERL